MAWNPESSNFFKIEESYGSPGGTFVLLCKFAVFVLSWFANLQVFAYLPGLQICSFSLFRFANLQFFHLSVFAKLQVCKPEKRKSGKLQICKPGKYENCKFSNQERRKLQICKPEKVKTANLQTRKGENCKFASRKMSLQGFRRI